MYYTHSGLKLHLCYRDFNERIKMNYTHIQDFYHECTYVCIHAHMHVHSRTYVHILSTYMYIFKCWQHRFVLFMSRTHSYIHVYINHQHTVFSSENRQLHPYSESSTDHRAGAVGKKCCRQCNESVSRLFYNTLGWGLNDCASLLY